MKWKFFKNTNRLNIYGDNNQKDIIAIKNLIQTNKIPSDINSIVYQKSTSSTVAMMIRGVYLTNLLKTIKNDNIFSISSNQNNTGNNVYPDLKTILKQINEANIRQNTYAGLVIYCVNTKKFLFVKALNKDGKFRLFGDYPFKDENPPDTVCRVAKEDICIEIKPEWLVNLMTLEINGTTYYNYLCFTREEFKPKNKYQCEWIDWKNYNKYNLYQYTISLFERDIKIQKLINFSTETDIDFEKLIDEILHSS